MDESTLESPLHPGVEPLAFLLGTWRGKGTVWFHTIAPTDFHEVVRFGHRGFPWLTYDQRSWAISDDQPLHTEMGFWRMVGENRVNIFVALTAGMDFSAGTLDGTALHLETTAAPMADGIEVVTALERHYEVRGDVLDYEVTLGTEAQPHQLHVKASLTRD